MPQKGDLDLSAVLTFVSTCASLFVLPAWVYTLGRVFSVEADIQIPMFRIFANLFITIGPCLVGFAINMFAPKVRVFVKRIAKPFMFVVLFSFFVLVIVTKIRSYMFIRWQHWLAGTPQNNKSSSVFLLLLLFVNDKIERIDLIVLDERSAHSMDRLFHRRLFRLHLALALQTDQDDRHRDGHSKCGRRFLDRHHQLPAARGRARHSATHGRRNDHHVTCILFLFYFNVVIHLLYC